MLPPGSVEVYQFSYSRSIGKMRFRLGNDEWLTSREVGRWEMLGANKRTGSLAIKCKLVLKGETAYLFSPEEADGR
jgi:hypothetical protein